MGKHNVASINEAGQGVDVAAWASSHQGVERAILEQCIHWITFTCHLCHTPGSPPEQPVTTERVVLVMERVCILSLSGS